MSVFNFSVEGNQPRIVACLDHTPHAKGVLTIAAGIARSLGRPLTLFHVIETTLAAGSHDPLEWNFRRCQARRYLERLAHETELLPEGMTYELAEGERVQELLRQGQVQGATLVLGASVAGHGNDGGRQTARLAVEAGAERVILVPETRQGLRLETILVPMDGSGFCEAALVEAMRLADQTGAGLLLVHVVPPSAMSLFGPPEVEDVCLRGQLDARNQSSASRYLERIRRRLLDRGIKARALCLTGEPRSTLAHLMAREKPGFVVLSTRGQSGQDCDDLSVGSTASYVLDHAECPVLILQTTRARSRVSPAAVSGTRMAAPTLAA